MPVFAGQSLVSASMVSHSARQVAEALKNEGNVLFAQGNYSAAIEKYSEALQHHQDWPVLHINRALCYRKQGRWEHVEYDCRKALELASESIKAHYFLGLALRETKRLSEAVKHLHKALELSREQGDSIKDDIWKELARAKYTLWQQESEARRREQAMLRARLQDLLWKQQAEELAKLGDGEGLRIRHRSEQEAFDRLFADAAQQDTASEPAAPFTCRLTMDVYREPVVTPSGLSYERSALLEHLQKVGNWDPVTREPITHKQLTPNLGLRAAAQQYLDEHPWAWGDCF